MTKTPTGVDFFDSAYGGTYAGRVLLVTGRAGAGKSTFGLQFVKKGLEIGEKGLMLSARASRDLAIQAGNIRLSADRATAENRLFLLEYQDFIPGRDREEDIMLPPDGFQQLKNVIDEYSIRRIVLDSVLPWVMMTTPEHLPEHIFSFVRAVERLGVTAVFALPKPVSQAAVRLRRLLEDLAPVSVTLDYDPVTKRRFWAVNKYLGRDPETRPTEMRFEPGCGWVAGVAVAPPPPAVAESVPWSTPPAPVAPAPPPPVPEPVPWVVIPPSPPRVAEPPSQWVTPTAQPRVAEPSVSWGTPPSSPAAPRYEPQVRPGFAFSEPAQPRVVPPPPPPNVPPPPTTPAGHETKEPRISFADIMLPNR